MAVRIRMKKLGRKHRPFYRICASDSRSPRDGKVLEELGTYDPMIRDTDARTTLNHERIQYWLGVGAKPTDKVGVLLKKYGPNGKRLKEAEEARAKLKLPRVAPPAPAPVELPKPAAPEAPAAEGAPAPEASGPPTEG